MTPKRRREKPDRDPHTPAALPRRASGEVERNHCPRPLLRTDDVAYTEKARAPRMQPPQQRKAEPVPVPDRCRICQRRRSGGSVPHGVRRRQATGLEAGRPHQNEHNKRPGAEHRAKSGCRVFVGRTGCVHVWRSRSRDKNLRQPGRFLHRPIRPRRRESAQKGKRPWRAWHTPGPVYGGTKPILAWGRPGLRNLCKAHAAEGP